MGGGGHWGFETRGGASGSGLGVCVVCARPQPEPCPAWLYSRPCQPARHALFRGFQVDRLRGEPPQAQGGGRQGRRSLFSWFVHALTSAPGSAGSWRHHVPWPFQSPPPPDPSCLPCSPSCSHHLLPALATPPTADIFNCNFILNFENAIWGQYKIHTMMTGGSSRKSFHTVHSNFN